MRFQPIVNTGLTQDEFIQLHLLAVIQQTTLTSLVKKELQRLLRAYQKDLNRAVMDPTIHRKLNKALNRKHRKVSLEVEMEPEEIPIDLFTRVQDRSDEAGRGEV